MHTMKATYLEVPTYMFPASGDIRPVATFSYAVDVRCMA